jgi:hypothetical protein
MKRKKRLFIGFVCLTVIVAGYVLYSRVYGTKPLLQQSRRFVTIKEIGNGRPASYGLLHRRFKHVWVAGDRMIYRDSDASGNDLFFSKRLSDGVVSRLKGMTARVHAPNIGNEMSWDVSSDGMQFVFVWFNEAAAIPFTTHECDLDGRNYNQTDSGGLSALWMPNGKQWLELEPDYVRIYSLAGADGKRPPPVELSLDEHSPLRRNTTWRELEIALIHPDYHVWIPEFLRYDIERPSSWLIDKLSISDIDLKHGGKTSHSWNISLPFTAVVQTARISPDGKQIAMTLTTSQTSSFGRFMKRFFSSYPDNVTTAGLWVANIDGKNMHCLGTVVPPQNRAQAYPRDLRWLPGSKRISYLYGNGIYIVPAN